MIPDYLGYGMSGGSTGEQGVYASAEACWDYLESSGRVDTTKICAGGLVAGSRRRNRHCFEEKARCGGDDRHFTSLHAMGRELLPFLPTGLLLKHHFPSDERIKQIHVPILIIHGDRDSIIPPIMASQLENAAISPVTRIMIPGGDHNDVFEVGGDEMYDGLPPSSMKM